MAIEVNITLIHQNQPDDYRVEQHPHGVVIRARKGDTIPVSLFSEYAAQWPKGQISPDIAHVLRCVEHGRVEYEAHTVIAKSEEAALAWRAEVTAMISETLSPVQRFLWSADYGLSAGYLIYALTNETAPDMPAVKPAYPYDFDSFRRCCIALDTTGLRPRLKEMPMFGPYHELVALWPVLERAMAKENYDYVEDTLQALLRLRDPKRVKITFEHGSVSVGQDKLTDLIEHATGATVTDLKECLERVGQGMGAKVEFPDE
jgi:hypothetical protein